MLNHLHTLLFETVPEAGAGGVEPEPVEGEVDAWHGPTQDEWQQTVSALTYLSEQEQARIAAQEGEQAPSLDLFGDDPAEQIRQLVREETAPFAQFTEQARDHEANQEALDIIASLESEGGDFLGKAGEGEKLDVDSRAVARQLADSFYPEFAARHGDTPQAAEAALTKAVETVRALEQAIGKAYSTRQQNQLHTLAGTPREPSAAGVGEGTGEVRPRGGDEFEVLRRFAPIG